ncbi:MULTISPECIES: zinc-binding dehydrogenase [Nocardia]|uniref:zinc-binding dehydrogenase n=1 Tax=Nocardia abscessus TaxID=120957 RepID=UPI001894B943|nr:zinc-binding dehydrogenase [Nocardia abscessus]MBF6472626.1 zinc-binding dehydrogenase [Nocardia abscessus]
MQRAAIDAVARLQLQALDSSKEDVAKRFGATDFLQPIATENTLADQVTELLSGPADYSFECVGNTRLIEQALAMVNPFSGVCVAVGIAPGGSELTLPASRFWMGRRLQGTFLGNVNPLTDIPRIVDWYCDGTVLLDELVTHRLNHANINDGFDLVSSGQAVRTVVVY